MADYELKTKAWVPINRTSLFESFSDAFNLEVLTPPFLGFSIITSSPIEMKIGQIIDYRLKLHGLPIRWRTEITAWEPPLRFEDSQLRGPYSSWVHTHTFEEVDGGTLMTDIVRYSVPGGALVHGLFVKRDLLRIFAYRQKQLPKLLGGDALSYFSDPISIQRLTSHHCKDAA